VIDRNVGAEAIVKRRGSTVAPAAVEIDAERSELLEALGKQRLFLRYTMQGLTDEQARTRPTVSELCLGGLVKHVADVERSWVTFIVEGPTALGGVSEMTEHDWARRRAEFRLLDGETLAGVLADYEATAAATDELVRTLPDLGATQPLPTAPWFPPMARWSARRVLLHIIAETAQHCGHADILRESIDGQKTMG
jgi:uncharacterized damage-inducible protein DinB